MVALMDELMRCASVPWRRGGPPPGHGSIADKSRRTAWRHRRVRYKRRMPAPLTDTQIQAALRRANALAQAALDAGHHPFGALLLDADGTTVLMTQGNVSAVEHAEAVLAREAARRFSPERLWGCALVTTVEPCAMCAGTQYWAHIGRLVFGMSERELLALTGNHTENPTLDLPCRDVFARGQKAVEVIGPVAAVREEIAALHRDFWSRR
jgi:tRNA(Arg) A34 adenosine deaminase TadA